MKRSGMISAALAVLSMGLSLPALAAAGPGTTRSHQTEAGSAPSTPGKGKTVREPASRPDVKGHSAKPGAPSGGKARHAKRH